MKLLFGERPADELAGGCVATIGNFDGVHKGHQALLALLRKQATMLAVPLLVVLFEPQPREFFAAAHAPARLYRLREKINALADCGVDYVYCVRFNHALAAMPAVDFARQILFLRLQIKYLLVGEDFLFGHARQGNVLLLKKLGAAFECEIAIFPTFMLFENRVSSTIAREALRAGNLSEVENLLGRQYAFSARVVYGDGIGRQWGIPTANLHFSRKTLPFTGVFCVRVQRSNGNWFDGVANIGHRPTLNGLTPRVEVHILDLDDSLYGERLNVVFLHKLRDEVKFPDVDALIAQIHTDVAHARAYFK